MRALKDYDSNFYWKPGGKGSHRFICHDDIRGRKRQVTTGCHGDGDEVKKYVVKECCNNFELPPDTL